MTIIGVLALSAWLAGCSKEPVELVSAEVVADLDKGSGNFDRVLKLCFTEPLRDNYYHQVTILTHESFKLTGEGVLRPLVTDPDNPCQLKSLYMYIHKDSPIGARELIKEYVVPGNIRQILVQVYADKPEGKERPMTEKVFTNL
jgi:hypothetical protein